MVIVIQSFNSDPTGNAYGVFTFKWYKEMLNDKDLMGAIFYTILTSVLATVASVVLGTIFALGIW